MRIGMELGSYTWDGGPEAIADTLVATSRTADDAGFAYIGVADHLWQNPPMGNPEQPFLECFTALATIGAHTRHCRLGPMVAGVHFRAPALLIKSINTLDVLTGGRAVLGLGVGWYEDEAVGSGVAFPPLADRMAMLEETLQIGAQLAQGDSKPFRGRHFQLEEPRSVPAALSGRPVPVLLGGGGRRTLGLVARYADACNLYPGPDLAEKLDLLRALCAAEGRDYDTIEKTCIMPFDATTAESADALVPQLRELAALGIQLVVGIIGGTAPARQVEIIGERVIPAVAGL